MEMIEEGQMKMNKSLKELEENPTKKRSKKSINLLKKAKKNKIKTKTNQKSSK